MSPSYSREINGPRPSPLKIHKDSRQIHKPSSTSSSTNSNHHRRHPVIIYTQSPKVIHTQPRDFMVLVQKLTGFHPNSQPPLTHPKAAPADDSAACGRAAADVTAAESGSVNDCALLDMPLLSWGSTDLFCSPRDFYVGGSMLPSFMEAVKAFPKFS